MDGSALAAAVDELLAGDLEKLDAAAVLDLTRLVETVSRRLPAVEHRLVAQLERRQLAHEHACRDTASLLAQMLRLTPGQARARVQAAHDLGPRRALSGAELDPVFTRVADLQRRGAITPGQARVVVQCIDRLPDEVVRANESWLEQQLCQFALDYDERRLRLLAHGLADRLNPDGGYRDEDEQHRRRGVRLTTRPDGMGQLEGLLDAETLAALHAVFDALAAPAPEDGGLPDPRTPAQRQHDALHTGAQMLLRSDLLPDCGGVTAAVQFTVTTEQVHAAARVYTSHGVAVSMRQACRLAADGLYLPVLLGEAGQLVGHGRTRRLASRAQRMALAARDGGCCFPGVRREALVDRVEVRDLRRSSVAAVL